MGRRNYLVEGGSGVGKTSVATALEARGHHVVHGDRALAYQGDPDTGKRVAGDLMARHALDAEFISHHHIWDLAQVKTIVADRSHDMTFFCGASRNRHAFIHLFDAVFVLESDWDIINRRLDGRPNEWGSRPEERALIRRLHAMPEQFPPGAIRIDATASLDQVVNAILEHCP